MLLIMTNDGSKEINQIKLRAYVHLIAPTTGLTLLNR